MSDLITAIQKAIADICAARLCEVNSMSSRQEMLRLMIQATDTLRAALAQQEQEPKAWMLTDDSGMRFVSVDRPHPDFVPLYTHPPRRERQGLTEEEINELSHTMVKGHKSVNWLTRAIETKLKEKNV